MAGKLHTHVLRKKQIFFFHCVDSSSFISGQGALQNCGIVNLCALTYTAQTFTLRDNSVFENRRNFRFVFCSLFFPYLYESEIILIFLLSVSLHSLLATHLLSTAQMEYVRFLLYTYECSIATTHTDRFMSCRFRLMSLLPSLLLSLIY